MSEPGSHSNISEDEFWELLRFRIMSGAQRSTEQLHGYCDWVDPKKYILDGLSPRITGRMGFLRFGAVENFEFTLFLRRAVASLDEIEWAMLMPHDECGEWLSFDKDYGRIEIHPSFAVNPSDADSDAASESK